MPDPATVQRFLDHLRHERRLSHYTAEAYRRDLDTLSGFVRNTGWQDGTACKLPTCGPMPPGGTGVGPAVAAFNGLCPPSELSMNTC